MKVQAIKTRIFRQGEDLIDFIINHIGDIKKDSVIIVTSKIVALAEKRTIISDIKGKEKLIRAESKIAIPTKYVWLTVTDGQLMANAGIDESNANGKFILLPKDSFKSASRLRQILRKKFHLKNLGVLITDSRTTPLRAGVTGVALGYAGFCGIKDYVGKPDIFGRKFKFSKTNVADSLASAAVLVMGEGAERQPLAVITQAPVKFCKKIKRRQLQIDISDDMYQPLFSQLSKLKS